MGAKNPDRTNTFQLGTEVTYFSDFLTLKAQFRRTMETENTE